MLWFPTDSFFFPQGYPLFSCGAGCRCNQLGKTKLREALSVAGPESHMQENLSCKFPQGFLAISALF